MLNMLWSAMLLLGMLWGAASGNLEEVTQGLITSAREAVTLGIAMSGIMSFWCGVLEVGNQAGLLEWFSGKLDPVLDFLFPGLERGHPARKPIAVNMAANLFGLGMAATPAGLEAMQELSKDCKDQTATREMCTFLILNISSLQLIPVTMIAYRSEYGSADPAAILTPALLATAASTAAAVIFCRCMDRKRGRRR